VKIGEVTTQHIFQDTCALSILVKFASFNTTGRVVGTISRGC